MRHEIVHNPHVVARLREKGAIFVDELAEVPPGSLVIFSAHGVAPAVREEARARGVKTIDATCPLVTKVHLEALRLAKEGFELILVGHEGHPEVVGTMGEIPTMRLVGSVEEAVAIQPHNGRVAALTQTTLSMDDTGAIIKALRSRIPGLRVKNDICYATQNRQDAVKTLADKVDLFLVVGARNSSNSNRLREVAQGHSHPAHLIGDASELRPEWFNGVKAVAITSGASTPEDLVQGVVRWLEARFGVTVKEVEASKESVVFQLPKELRQPVR